MSPLLPADKQGGVGSSEPEEVQQLFGEMVC